MKTTISILLLTLTSCIGTSTLTKTSGLSDAELSAIPKGATEVVIQGEDRESLYNKIVDVLIQRGHRISREDKERFYIVTEGKDVGESTLQRMTITINENNEAVIKSEWMPGMEATNAASAFSGLDVSASWSIASYEVGRPGIAYAEAVAIGKIVGGNRTYR